MKRTLGVALALAVLAFAHAGSWRYATFTAVFTGDQAGQTRWETDRGSTNDDSLDALLADLNVPRSSGDSALGAMLNWAGARGWELVQVLNVNNTFVYLFKRPGP